MRIETVLRSRDVPALQRRLGAIGIHRVTATPFPVCGPATPASAAAEASPDTRVGFLTTAAHWCGAVEVLRAWMRDGRLSEGTITLARGPPPAHSRRRRGVA